jgi:dihydrolipoamide dehydrogenase
MSEQYDVVIIGSGPGGYVCAIRCAQLGLKTACVEKEDTLGGTCLNVGCIPSKALLHASERFDEADKHFADLGIKVKPELDLKAMMKHKSGVVDANTQGIKFLFKKNKIDHIVGTGTVKSADTVEIKDAKGKTQSLKHGPLSLPQDRKSPRCPALKLMKNRLCRRPARWNYPRCLKKWRLLAAA